MRYPITRADLLDIGCALVVAVLVIGAPLAGFTIRAPEPTFTLLDFAPDGEVYALDTGLTGEDCEGFRLRSVRALACEPEA